jgi:hypothetical protein
VIALEKSHSIIWKPNMRLPRVRINGFVIDRDDSETN